MRALVRGPSTRKVAKLPVFASCFACTCPVAAQRLPSPRNSRSTDDNSLLGAVASRSWRGMLRKRFFFSFQRLLTPLFGSLFGGDEDSQVFGHQQRNLLRWPVCFAAQPGDDSDQLRQDPQRQRCVAFHRSPSPQIVAVAAIEMGDLVTLENSYGSFSRLLDHCKA